MIEKILIYIPKIIEHTYIAKAFYNVLYMSILAIIVGLVIYLIQEILDKKITPKWKITLWLVLLIALIVPINNSSKYQNNNWLLKTLQPIQNISFKKEVQDKEALYNSYIQKEDTNYQDYKTNLDKNFSIIGADSAKEAIGEVNYFITGSLKSADFDYTISSVYSKDNSYYVDVEVNIKKNARTSVNYNNTKINYIPIRFTVSYANTSDCITDTFNNSYKYATYYVIVR